jgi:6-phosphogluconolactonase (cycloisomerase 2 family)
MLMRFFLIFACVAFGLAGCGGGIGSKVVVRSKMLYVAQAGHSRIQCFDLEENENETPEEGEADTENWPIYRVGTDAPVIGFALTPNLKWLFAINELGNVEMFESRLSGRLNQFAGPIIPAGDATKAVAITPDSGAIYFATDAGKVFGYKIESAGATVPGTPGGIAGPTTPVMAVVRPDGKAFYVSDGATKIWQYEILPNGGLQPLSPANVDVAGGPTFMFWNAGGTQLYVSCKDSDQIAQFSTVPGGQIAEASRVAGPSDPGQPVLDATESFLYVPENAGAGEIWRYQAQGTLTPLTPPRLTNHNDQVEARPFGLDIFVLNGTNDNYSNYRVAEDGTLILRETRRLLTNPVASVYRRLP